MLKRAVESGDVAISAVRHKKPRAKSEPNLTAAVMAELAADTNYYTESHEAVTHPEESNIALRHYSAHDKDPKMASANMSRIGYPESFLQSGDQKENEPEISFLKDAELKLEQIRKIYQAKAKGEHPETYFGGTENYGTKHEDYKDMGVDGIKVIQKPSGPDFWEVPPGDEVQSSISGSHTRGDSNTSWSSGRGSLASDNQLPSGTPIQVNTAAIILLNLLYLSCAS